jgi:hypothetical protein
MSTSSASARTPAQTDARSNWSRRRRRRRRGAGPRAARTSTGLRYRYIKIDSTFDTTSLLPQTSTAADPAQSQVSQLGLAGELDSRDSEYNPRSGLYANAQWLVAADALGSDFDYPRFTGRGERLSQRRRQDRAGLARLGLPVRRERRPSTTCATTARATTCAATPPGNIATTRCSRSRPRCDARIYGRFGAVAFVGVGEVASEFSKMNTKDLLPAAGIGARFEASTKYHVNLSIDYAVGNGSSALYFYVGEAF